MYFPKSLQFEQGLTGTACLCSAQCQPGQVAPRLGLASCEDSPASLPRVSTGRQRAGAGQRGILGHLASVCFDFTVSLARQVPVSGISYMSTSVPQGFCTVPPFMT